MGLFDFNINSILTGLLANPIVKQNLEEIITHVRDVDARITRIETKLDAVLAKLALPAPLPAVMPISPEPQTIGVTNGTAGAS